MQDAFRNETGGQGRLTWLARLRVMMFLLILVVIVSYQLTPVVNPQQRDSGVFAYIGHVITEGGVPYRDAWDNKLPGVYFVDALAFVLFGTNRWAIWIVEGFSVFLTALAMFWLVNRTYNRPLAWVAAIMFVFSTRNPALVSDTNFTEVYALLPQVMCFVAGYLFFLKPTRRWAYVIGLSAGLAFMFKQTTVGNALVFIPTLLLVRHRLVATAQRFKWLAIMVAGGLTPLFLTTLYLLMNGVLWEAINASFISSRAFHKWVSGDEPVMIWDTVWQTLTASSVPLWLYPLLPFWIGGVFILVRRLRRGDYHADEEQMAHQTLLVWAALSLVADLVLANYTYRAHEHYYVPLLPSVTILVVTGLDGILRRHAQPGFWARLGLAGMWIYFAAAIVLGPLGGTVYRLWLVDWDFNGPAPTDPMTEWVLQNTAPEDKVLVWGAMPTINFQSLRESPVPYHYAYPLIVPEYTSPEQVQEMVFDLQENLPLLIIDRALMDGYRVPPLDDVRREIWWEEGGRRDTADLGMLYGFVADHCDPVEEIERAVIYRCE